MNIIVLGFSLEFYDLYFKRLDKYEFGHLEQASMTVVEYKAYFYALFRYFIPNIFVNSKSIRNLSKVWFFYLLVMAYVVGLGGSS